MNPELPEKAMPEAEVTLRLAFRLIDRGGQGSYAKIAIDGAHIRIKRHYAKDQPVDERIVFDVAGFLRSHECDPKGELKDGWQGSYIRKGGSLAVKAEHGMDVEVRIGSRLIRAECKGGPLELIKGKSPNAILASAIGQVVCAARIAPGDDLWVAVPDSSQFRRVAEQISKAPVFQRTGIRLAVVARDGGVHLAKRIDSDVEWVDLDSAIQW